MGNHTKQKLYGLKDSGIAWFDKPKEVMEAKYVVQSRVDLCVWYKE